MLEAGKATQSKKETLVQIFSCEFYELFKNTSFTEQLRTIASDALDFIFVSRFALENTKACLVTVVTEAITWRCSVRKLFLEVSQKSQENTCARVSFLIKLQADACNFIKK